MSDNVNDKPQPAPTQPAVDWYDQNQGKPAGAAKPADASPAKPAPTDPYDFNQGAPAKPGDAQPPKPGSDKGGGLTLFDVAKQDLIAQKKGASRDEVYQHLNELMVKHGHAHANIDGKTGINDHMLPKSWNRVDPKTLEDVPHHHKGKDHPAKHHEPKHPEKAGSDQTQPPPPPHERVHDHRQAVPHPAEAPQYQYPQQQQQQYYNPQPQPNYYRNNDAAQQIGNFLGSVLGGVGAGLLFGGHHRGYYPGYYGGDPYYGYGYQPPIVFGGGWGGGWHRGRR